MSLAFNINEMITKSVMTSLQFTFHCIFTAGSHCIRFKAGIQVISVCAELHLWLPWEPQQWFEIKANTCWATILPESQEKRRRLTEQCRWRVVSEDEIWFLRQTRSLFADFAWHLAVSLLHLHSSLLFMKNSDIMIVTWMFVSLLIQYGFLVTSFLFCWCSHFCETFSLQNISHLCRKLYQSWVWPTCRF